MVAIYLTGITIAMLNFTGIGFVIFMILFNRQSSSQLKRANFKKSLTIKDTIKNNIDKFSINEGKSANHGGLSTNKANTGEVTGVGVGLVTANSNKNKDFDNIDDILNDLDLSEFDNLDLDDFS